MTRLEVLKLIHDYGDACFDCGEWQHDPDPTEPYETVYAAVEAAKNALIGALIGACAFTDEAEKGTTKGDAPR